MCLAMGIAAFICIFLGVYPAPLYNILPYPVNYEPYTAFHVVGMLQLLMFGALAFAMLILSGYYPSELRAVNLDTDWLFRMPGRAFIKFCKNTLKTAGDAYETSLSNIAGRLRKTPALSVGIENRADNVFHKMLTSVPMRIFRLLQPLKTEINELEWNLTYILAFFIILLFTILI